MVQSFKDSVNEERKKERKKKRKKIWSTKVFKKKTGKIEKKTAGIAISCIWLSG